MTRPGSAILAALAGLLLATVPSVALSAQAMRGYSVSRPVNGSPPTLRASLEFGGGRVQVDAGSPANLYRMLLSYDADRFSPVQRYDQRTGILELGVMTVGAGGLRVTSADQLDQAARFEFSPDVPLILRASLGTSNATVDLGGLMLEEVAISAGATRSVIRFSEPTTGHCREATFTAGAGELVIEQLPQSGCGVVHLEGGIGRTLLDFSGEWQNDIRVEADVSIGTVVLRVPRGVGLSIAAERFLTSISADEMKRTSDGWETAGYADAKQKIAVAIRASVAGIVVEWFDSATR